MDEILLLLRLRLWMIRDRVDALNRQLEAERLAETDLVNQIMRYRLAVEAEVVQ